MIICGTFTSVWADEGEIETKCKVNTETHEVFDIEHVDPADYGMECEILEYEYVEFGDGKNLHRFPVEPGFSGQAFMDMTDKIREIKKHIGEKIE